MKKLFFAFVAVFALLAGCSSGEDDPREDGVEGTFELHSFLQDGMVIQQNRPFRLWGKASGQREDHRESELGPAGIHLQG